MKFTSELLVEKIGMRIDHPCSDGGTTSTGNIARQCFMNINQFLFWINSLISSEFDDIINKIHMSLSVILRIYNSNREVNTDRLESQCKDTYESIIFHFKWVNITPYLHKILAHSSELIKACNSSHGLKDLSEEAVEVCNKLIRKYREHLGRKFSFSLNMRDIFIRLVCNTDPVLNTFRRNIKCKKCADSDYSCRRKIVDIHLDSHQDTLFVFLTVGNSSVLLN